MISKAIFIPSTLCGLAVILGGCVTDNSTHTTNNTKIEVKNSSGKAAASVSSSRKNSNAPKFDVDAVIKEMVDNDFECGESSDAGIWVVTKVHFSADEKIPVNELISRATIIAKQNISEWMSTDASASTTLQSESNTVNEKTDISEQLKTEVKTNSKAFLRGVTMHSRIKNANGFTAFFYATGKIADRTAELEAQLKAAPPGVVRAVGFGVIVDGKIGPAKREARQAALRNAVEQVMGTTVIGQSQLMDNEKAKSKVISQTAGNIKEYRVVKEDQDGPNYQMIINAKVDEKNLLDNYAAMVRSMGNPGFMVKCQDPDLKAAFSGFLAELGFKVVNRVADAAFIVDGNCKYIAANHDYYGKGIQIDLNLRLIDQKSGQEFFNISNDPRFTTSFSGSLHQIRQSSAKKAFNKMRQELHEKLNKVVMDWVLNGREVTVTFKNATNTALDEILAKSVADVPCAKFQTRSRNVNTLVLHCSYVGPSADFEEFLRNRMKKDLPKGTALPQTEKIELNSLEFVF